MDPFEYRIDLLKWELDNIESSIRKIDDMGNNNTKNWAIVTWAGVIAVILRDASLHKFMYLTAIPPFLFMLADVFWRRLQRRFIFRMNKISKFINSKEFDEAIANKDMSCFHVLDPFSRLDKAQKELQDYIAVRRVLSFPTVSLIYIGQALLSLAVWLIINCK